ncbi:MAG TPA: 30S ribosomal protein S6 [Candidatus Dependentiae bacterium]|jgi:small subunit ribosomal protein S6|nr:30S ribosomal protein S6 [Candidatus Dependentiae bacterium]
MARYEILLLTIPEITEDEIKNVESQVQGILRTAKGTFISFERWGKFRLAYPVKKNEYGVYFLVRFELPSEASDTLKELKNLVDVKFYDIVMRSMVSVLDSKQSLVYQRPTSLEEAPRREAGSFLRPGKHADSRANDSITLDEDVEEDYEGEEKALEQ